MYIVGVDDLEEDRYLLKVLLEEQGHRVETCEDGQQALELIRQERPDLVISDVLMPVMDGYNLLYTLKQDKKLYDLPFIFYTATFTGDDDRELALRLGADRFLLKPAEIDTLVSEAVSVVEEHRHTQPWPKPQLAEIDYYRSYSRRLLTKLEERLIQQENSNRLLRERGEELVRRNEENNRLLGQLQTALRLRDRFLAVAAHETRTPLTIIKGWLQLSERELGKMLAKGPTSFNPEKLRLNLRKAIAQAQHLERLLNDMGDTTEATEGQLTFNLQPLDLAALLQRVVNDEEFVSEQHIIRLELPAGSGVTVEADTDKLSRALGNLLDNAIKFTPQGGEIVIRLKPDHEENQAIITVSDNGPGIAPEQRDRLFKPYYQGESDPFTRRYKGMGLGLFVTKTVIERQGGHLELAPHPAGEPGTTFSIRLPLYTA